ncbi:MAG: hypothetical protein KDD13_00205 [Mangrovimonas sp.]|nr:hypothetical protein [Mangrovimonas sp.]
MAKTKKTRPHMIGNTFAKKPEEYKVRRHMIRWAVEEFVQKNAVEDIPELYEKAKRVGDTSFIKWLFEFAAGRAQVQVNVDNSQTNVQVNLTKDQERELAEITLKTLEAK